MDQKIEQPATDHITVFVSYCHESPQHTARVLALADRLRQDGLDVILDQYEGDPPEGWPTWMNRQLKAADVVLIICTASYGTRKGSKWEIKLIFQHIYAAGAEQSKFIPVLFADSNPEHVPTPLQDKMIYRLDGEEYYKQLYWRLTNQHKIPKPPVGKFKPRPKLDRPHIPGDASDYNSPFRNLSKIEETNMHSQERLLKKITERREEWNLLHEKLSRLNKTKILETDVEDLHKLEHRIAEIEAEYEKVEHELAELENQLTPETRMNLLNVKSDSASLSGEESKTKKFFISYPHGDPDEERFAQFLQTQFVISGHEVFIDRGMKAGIDWVEEINTRILWCDYLIVLLSERAMNSEMVQAEVRLARKSQRNTTTPEIIPVRLRYFGPLEYELDLYIGHLQFIKWHGPEDSQNVFTAILQGSKRKVFDEHGYDKPAHDRGKKEQEKVSSIQRRPQPHIDPRAAYIPGGTLKTQDPYYISRPADHTLHVIADRVGETVVIKAPRQFGKSSLLLRYLAKCQEVGKQFVLIDFSSFTMEDFSTYPDFLSKIAAILARKLGIPLEKRPDIRSQDDAVWFIEDHILNVLNAPLVIAFDEADRTLGWSHQTDFFTMLRSWHNSRADKSSSWRNPWINIDLALVISTEPYLLIKEQDRSPFNVSPPIQLEPFQIEQYQELNEKYDAFLSNAQLEQLWELLQGHPYLTRLSYYHLATLRSCTFDILMECSMDDKGPFGDHLRALLSKLHENSTLLDALKNVIRKGAISDDDLYYRLHGAGLVKKEADRVNPANLLYARYFKNVL